MRSLRKRIKGLVNSPLKRFGFELVRFTPSGEVFTAMEASAADLKIYQSVQSFTMADPDPIFSLVSSVRYVIENKIKGTSSSMVLGAEVAQWQLPIRFWILVLPIE